MGNKVSAFGLFKTTAEAEQALDGLIAAQCPSDAISIIMLDSPFSRKASGTLGFLLGLASVKFSEGGNFLIAGPVRSEVEKSNLGGVGLATSLQVLGFSQADSERVASAVGTGSALLAVRCGPQDDTSKVSELLVAAGAELFPPTEIGAWNRGYIGVPH